MNSLFGLSTTTLMLIMLGLMAVCLLLVGAILLVNRTMFRMGIRNIPRRQAQSALVVLGLMLSTLIVSAAFTTGDSLDYSITRDVYTILGPIDEILIFKASNDDPDAGRPYLPHAVATNLETRFVGQGAIEAVIPAIGERVPVFNPATRQSEPQMSLLGIDAERTDRVGGLRYVDGSRVDFAALPRGSALLNPKAADILQAKSGDRIQILVNNRALDVTVAGLVRPTLLTGWSDSGPGTRNTGGITMPLAAVQELLGKPGQINFVGISNVGDTRTGVKRTDEAVNLLEPVLANDEQRAALGFGNVAVTVEATKRDNLKTAETVGSIFTAFFLVLGLFSMAAGVLLIFMIFVMLASERKAEMGMARAVGLKRRNLIQTFVAEGMAYTLAAGLVGAALGVVAAWLLVVIAANFLFADSFSMELRVTPRSLVIARWAWC